ncbi:MAG: SDR family oxidoreductase [Pseudobacteriovorax sp.]|nr:SDR family oxidoreductase [Pseudobacteriovorax sp.]
MSENSVIFGATSTLAVSIAKRLAERHDHLFLIARSQPRLNALKDDLMARGAASVSLLTADFSKLDTIDPVCQSVIAKANVIHKVFVCHGVLGNQELAQQDITTAFHDLDVNFSSYVAILTPIANQMETDGVGTIIVISSVAGDRGRQSNYIYGTAKAATTAFTSGLRNRLHRSNVSVLTVKPGFMDTAMTQHLKKNPLFISADRAAEIILKALDSRKNIVYVPRFWQLIMLLIKAIPETLFKRLKL